MSPEQLQGSRWTIGGHFRFGVSAYDVDQPQAVSRRDAGRDIERPVGPVGFREAAQHNPELPASLEPIILRCLELEPANAILSWASPSVNSSPRCTFNHILGGFRTPTPTKGASKLDIVSLMPRVGQFWPGMGSSNHDSNNLGWNRRRKDNGIRTALLRMCGRINNP